MCTQVCHTLARTHARTHAQNNLVSVLSLAPGAVSDLWAMTMGLWFVVVLLLGSHDAVYYDDSLRVMKVHQPPPGPDQRWFIVCVRVNQIYVDCSVSLWTADEAVAPVSSVQCTAAGRKKEHIAA